MSDSTLETVVIPPATLGTWTPKGEWLPSTAYAVNDTVAYFGFLYLVIFAHTSQPTFDAAASDGLGHNYYALILPKEPIWGRTITDTSYTTVLSDADTYMRFSNAAGCFVTIDPAVVYPAWTEMHFRDESGADPGALSIECPTPGSINPITGFNNTTLTSGGTITVKQVANSGTWDIMGLLYPST
jgi:hypothetical protein